MSHPNNQMFDLICPGGMIVRMPAIVLSISGLFNRLIGNMGFALLYPMPMPGWIMERLMIWMETFALDCMTNNFDPLHPSVMNSSLGPSDVQLGIGNLLDLYVLHLSGIYLEIPRLIVVSEKLIADRTRGLTEQQIDDLLAHSRRRHFRDYFSMYRYVMRNV